MTDENSDRDHPGSTTPDQERQSRADSEAHPLTTEAERYARLAAEQPASLEGKQNRIVELLNTEAASASTEERLHRRAAASTALTRLADEDVGTIMDHVDTLVDELRTERTREMPSEGPQMQTVSREVMDNLVRTLGLVITEQPHVVAEIEDSAEFIHSISPDLETETLRIATEALFASASALQHPSAAVEILGELLTYPDEVVQAWSAGALGQLAEENPNTVAAVADDLRALLDQDAETVQHNAVEALGALVRERPDVVVPAAPALRDLLDHTAVAIQHNAAGVLGRLAERHPEVVLPAVDAFKRLCDHDDEAVRNVAAATLTRLADD